MEGTKFIIPMLDTIDEVATFNIQLPFVKDPRWPREYKTKLTLNNHSLWVFVLPCDSYCGEFLITPEFKMTFTYNNKELTANDFFDNSEINVSVYTSIPMFKITDIIK